MKNIDFFEKWLSLWVGICILAGVILGNIFPNIFDFLSSLEYASVNLVVAVLIWGMVYPMMVKVDFSSLRNVASEPKGLIVTSVVNWLIKPFTMAGVGILFFEILFVDFINPIDAKQYLAGLILLGAAPCTAMVFIWSQLTNGDANYTLVQVSLNDVIMVFAFVPIVAFLLGVTDFNIPWQTLILSVGLYVIIPLLGGLATRKYLCNYTLSKVGGKQSIEKLCKKIRPISIISLLATVILLFGFQGNFFVEKPLLILLIALPLILQSYGIFALTYWVAYTLRIPFKVAAPCALIGTSNFFELAVAVAISVFGLDSGAALATVVGVLVEVPVMLSLVMIANRTKDKFLS